MSTKGKYYRSKFRSNTIKIESNQSNEESVINIVNLPPEIYFSTASQFPMLSFNGNAKRKSTSITLDTKHSSSSNVCSQRLSVSNNYNDSKMSKSFRQDFKDNKNKKRIKTFLQERINPRYHPNYTYYKYNLNLNNGFAGDDQSH